MELIIVYGEIWRAVISEELFCECEISNVVDRYTKEQLWYYCGTLAISGLAEMMAAGEILHGSESVTLGREPSFVQRLK